MKMKTTGTTKSLSLIALFAVITFLVSACGSGGSSSTGGGGTSLGKASISGNVGNGLAFNQAPSPEAGLLNSIYTFAIPLAHAGTYVVLLEGTGDSEFRETATTDESGNFTFTNLEPGEYTISVVGEGSTSSSIMLEAGMDTEVLLSTGGEVLQVNVITTAAAEVGDGAVGVEDTVEEVGEVDVDGTVESLERVTICHNGKNTITISVNAVSAHVNNHNDTLGACTDSPDTPNIASDDGGTEDDETSEDEGGEES